MDSGVRARERGRRVRERHVASHRLVTWLALPTRAVRGGFNRRAFANESNGERGRPQGVSKNMLKRIIAIVFIFVCASLAWMVLGATIFSRTYGSGQNLDGRVAMLWGAPQSQSPPTAASERSTPK